MTATLLTLPDDPRLPWLLEQWGDRWQAFWPHPRAAWLRAYEDVLREYYPTASSDDLSLTARHYFPGYLSAGHDVP